MTPVSPVIPKCKLPETMIGAGNPLYKPLPAICMPQQGTVLTRWRLSLKERLRLLLTGSVYLHMLTHNKPLQPVMLQLDPPVGRPKPAKEKIERVNIIRLNLSA